MYLSSCCSKPDLTDVFFFSNLPVEDILYQFMVSTTLTEVTEKEWVRFMKKKQLAVFKITYFPSCQKTVDEKSSLSKFTVLIKKYPEDILGQVWSHDGRKYVNGSEAMLLMLVGHMTMSWQHILQKLKKHNYTKFRLPVEKKTLTTFINFHTKYDLQVQSFDYQNLIIFAQLLEEYNVIFKTILTCCDIWKQILLNINVTSYICFLFLIQ